MTLWSAFNWLNKYRLDVYILYVLFLVGNWMTLPMDPFKDDPRLLVGLVFLCGLIWIYLFNKTCDLKEDAISQPHEALQNKEVAMLGNVLPLFAIIPGIVLLIAALPLWPYLLYIGLGFLYSYPVYKGFRLKKVFFIKNAVSGFYLLSPMWFGFFVYFPPYYATEYYPSVTFLSALFFIYITGEILWDIRDVKGDGAAKVYTLPVVLGIKKTKIISYCFLAIALLLLQQHVSNYVVIAVMCTYVLFTHEQRSRLFFHSMLYVLSAIILINILWISSLS